MLILESVKSWFCQLSIIEFDSAGLYSNKISLEKVYLGNFQNCWKLQCSEVFKNCSCLFFCQSLVGHWSPIVFNE